MKYPKNAQKQLNKHLKLEHKEKQAHKDNVTNLLIDYEFERLKMQIANTLKINSCSNL